MRSALLLLGYICIAAILVGSLMPGGIGGVPWFRPVVYHLVGYGATAFILVLALGSDLRRIAGIVLALGAIGALTEVAQIWIPGRDAYVSDVLVNLAGAVIGVAVAWVARGLVPAAWLGATRR